MKFGSVLVRAGAVLTIGLLVSGIAPAESASFSGVTLFGHELFSFNPAAGKSASKPLVRGASPVVKSVSTPAAFAAETDFVSATPAFLSGGTERVVRVDGTRFSAPVVIPAAVAKSDLFAVERPLSRGLGGGGSGGSSRSGAFFGGAEKSSAVDSEESSSAAAPQLVTALGAVAPVSNPFVAANKQGEVTQRVASLTGSTDDEAGDVVQNTLLDADTTPGVSLLAAATPDSGTFLFEGAVAALLAGAALHRRAKLTRVALAA